MKNVYTKLLNIQRLIPVIEKDAENPFYKNMYATIDGIMSVILPIINAQNCTYTCPLSNLEGAKAMELSLFDTDSGEEIKKVFPLINKDDSQKEGGVITYTRRYMTASFFNIQLGDDDDGNTATGKTVQKAAVSAPQAPQSITTPVVAQSTKHCAVCNTEFIPPASYPKAINCSGACGAKYKTGERYTPPEVLPVIQQEATEEGTPLESIPF